MVDGFQNKKDERTHELIGGYIHVDVPSLRIFNPGRFSTGGMRLDSDVGSFFLIGRFPQDLGDSSKHRDAKQSRQRSWITALTQSV